MIDFTQNPIIPADYKSRGRGLPYEASPFSVSFVFNSSSEKDAVTVGLYQNPNRSPAERIRFEKEEQGGARMTSFLPQA